MVLQLTFNEFLRLRDAKGAAIEVLQGKVWITEDGKAGDSFLEPGRSYSVASRGLVVVGAESEAHFARVQVRKPEQSALGWLWGYFRKTLEERQAERTRTQLHELNDRMLRDIGLRRDQIDRIY